MQENREQSAHNDVQKSNEKQASFILKQIQRQFDYQNQLLAEQNIMLEDILKILKDNRGWKMIVNKLDLYPLTIIRDRHDGLYSRARYLAFNLRETEIPTAISASESECLKFWLFQQDSYKIGGGDTPDEAAQNLLEILKEKSAEENWF